MKRLWYFLSLLLVSPLTWAAERTLGAPQVMLDNDMSKQFLLQIFGNIEPVLSTSPPVANPLISEMFRQFNYVAMFLGVVIVGYTLVVATLKSAHEGSVLGQKWSTLWIPFRSVTGIALLLPKASGYCILQVITMWIVVQGIDAADGLWDYAAKNAYVFKGVQTGVPGPTEQEYGMYQSIFNNMVCMYKYNQLIGGSTVKVYDPETKKDVTKNNLYYPYRISLAGGSNVVNSYNVFPITKIVGSYSSSCGAVIWQQLPAPYNTGDVNGMRNSAIRNLIAGLAAAARLYVNNNGADPGGSIGSDLKSASNSYKIAMSNVSRAAEQIDEGSGRSTTGDTNLDTAINQGWIFAGALYLEILKPNKKGQSTKLKLFPLPGAPQGYCADGRPTTANCLAGTIPRNAAELWNLKLFTQQEQAKRDKEQAELEKEKKAQEEKAQKEEERRKRLGLGPKQGGQDSDEEEEDPKDKQEPIKEPNYGPELTKFLNAVDSSFVKDSIAAATGTKTPPQSGGSIVQQPKISMPKFSLGDMLMKPAFLNASWFNNVPILGPIVSEPVKKAGNFVSGMVDKFWDPINGFFADKLGGMLNRTFGFIYQQFAAGAADDLNFKNAGVNPLLQLQDLGQQLLAFVETVWIAGTMVVAGVAVALASGSFFSTSGVLAFLNIVIWLLSFFAPLLVFLFVAGSMLAFYLPLMPFVVFSFTAIGWMIAVIEAMIASPLVALGIMHPEGDEVMGQSRPAVLLIVDIFIRPSLMIIGLMAAMTLSWLAVVFVSMGVAYSAGGVFAGGISTLTSIIAIIILYCIFIIAVLHKCFGLIHVIPDKVLGWIGGGGRVGSQEIAQAAQGVESSFRDTSGQAGGGAMGGLNKAAGGTKKAGKWMQKQEGKGGLKEDGQKDSEIQVGSSPGSSGGGGGGGGGQKPSGGKKTGVNVSTNKGSQPSATAPKAPSENDDDENLPPEVPTPKD